MLVMSLFNSSLITGVSSGANLVEKQVVLSTPVCIIQQQLNEPNVFGSHLWKDRWLWNDDACYYLIVIIFTPVNLMISIWDFMGPVSLYSLHSHQWNDTQLSQHVKVTWIYSRYKNINTPVCCLRNTCMGRNIVQNKTKSFIGKINI